MELEAIRDIAKNLMINRKVHLEREKGGAYYHGQRVAHTALLLRKEILPDDSSKDNILTVAAWFHDVGKGIEPHQTYGAVIAREALRNHCTAEECEEIAGFIALHCLREPENTNSSPYIRLLQDADLLDHYGSFTIWMDFFHSACHNKTLLETAGYENAAWDKHCAESRACLNFQRSKAIFDAKIAFVNQFYERLRMESAGDYFG